MSQEFVVKLIRERGVVRVGRDYSSRVVRQMIGGDVCTTDTRNGLESR